MAADHAGPASAYRIVIHRLFTPFRQEKTAVAAITVFYQAVPACLWLTDPGGQAPHAAPALPKNKKGRPRRDGHREARVGHGLRSRRYNAGRA